MSRFYELLALSRKFILLARKTHIIFKKLCFKIPFKQFLFSENYHTYGCVEKALNKYLPSQIRKLSIFRLKKYDFLTLKSRQGSLFLGTVFRVTPGSTDPILFKSSGPDHFHKKFFVNFSQLTGLKPKVPLR